MCGSSFYPAQNNFPAQSATAIFAAALIAVLAGYAGSNPSANSAAVAGGILDVSISAEAGCLDGRSISATQQQFLGQVIHENVIAIDENGEIAPYLADLQDISPERKTYTFLLKEGVAFSDGSA